MVLRIQLMLNIVVACKGSSERIKGISLKHILCFDQCLIAIPNLYVLFFLVLMTHCTMLLQVDIPSLLRTGHGTRQSYLGDQGTAKLCTEAGTFCHCKIYGLNGIFCACLNDLTLVQRGVQLFLQWAMMQGVAMLLQNRYQRQRLYTRIALGKVPFPRYSA